MKRKRPFLCRIGFHRWQYWFEMIGSPLFECERCGCGRAELVRNSVYIPYEPEDMANIRRTKEYYEELEASQ